MSAFDDEVLAVLALLVEPTAVTALTKALNRGRAHKRGQRNLQGPRVRESCERLAQAGKLVVLDRGHRSYVVEAELAVTALAKLHEAGELERLVHNLESSDRPSRPWVTHVLRWQAHVRAAVATGDVGVIARTMSHVGRRVYDDRERGDGLVEALGPSPPPAVLDVIDDVDRDAYLSRCIEVGRKHLVSLSDRVLKSAGAGQRQLVKAVACYLALRGRERDALALVGPGAEGRASVEVVTAFLAGDVSRAAAVGLDACADLKRKHKFLTDEAGVLHALACIAHSGTDVRGLGHAAGAVEWAVERRQLYSRCYGPMLPLAFNTDRARFPPSRIPSSGLEAYAQALCAFWIRHRREDRAPEDPFAQLPPEWDRWTQAARAGGFAGLAERMDEVERAFARPDEATGPPAAFCARPKWEVALDTLECAIASVSANDASRSGKQRIVWELRCSEYGRTLTPRLLRSERARKGTVISVSTLLRRANDDALHLSDADRKVLAGVETEREEYGGRSHTYLGPRAWLGLIGHPHVVDELGDPVEIVSGTPTLVLESTPDGGASLMPRPRALVHSEITLDFDGPGRYAVFERPAAWEPVLEGLPQDGLFVPAPGVARLKLLLAELNASTPVQAVGLSFGDREVAAQRPLLVRLAWDGVVLELAARVAPFGAEGPHYPVGSGATLAVYKHDGEILTASRDFADERRRFAELRAAVPTPWPPDASELAVEDIELALETVASLDALGDTIRLAWPASRKLQVRRSRTGQDTDLRTTVRHDADTWLAVDVSLEVDDDTVLAYRQLLAGRDPSGRFVQLDDDTYVALTDAMRKRLEAIDAVASGRGDTIRVHAGALNVMKLDTESSGVELDSKSTSLFAGIRASLALSPRVPGRFAGELRDYQKDGFRWLARLCAARLGGCLADDMGLGKTVQSLALLCLRQELGPALVVGPTSVVGNWCDECRRFAPELHPHTLSDADREALIGRLGPGDVLILSYGLLVREQQALQATEFATAIFDEAHALKNSTSQRARASFAIKAMARVALTGTPIENHLGELWSVMNASVPGLLGTKRNFEERFAQPILRGHPGALDRLRQFLEPFLLRRTRREVLRELPPLTEITIRVPPTASQLAYYEAIRQRAVDHVESVRKNPGQQRMRLLAEITRLRQAAIDPRLLDEDLGPAGAKLDAVCERVTTLCADGHRVLVFTQFLGCIRRLEESLGEAGLEVLTLDGSTPERVRTHRIDAFQRGEADVFLMSLKAGGVGVNLTGAEYVVHVDPWWNPATEDQATARSHRMGQARPVTVYRMVSEGTIEERILALHETKRDLAENLLCGMEKASALDLEALRALLE